MSNPTRRPALLAVAFACTLGLLACNTAPTSASTGSVATPAVAAPITISARLSGNNEIPAVTSDAAGMLEGTLAPVSNVLTWKLTVSGLSGPATAAHFHGPATASQNAGVAVPINGSLTSPISGTTTLTASQVSELTAGRWYVNVHTAAHPTGEARGQITLRP